MSQWHHDSRLKFRAQFTIAVDVGFSVPVAGILWLEVLSFKNQLVERTLSESAGQKWKLNWNMRVTWNFGRVFINIVALCWLMCRRDFSIIEQKTAQLKRLAEANRVLSKFPTPLWIPPFVIHALNYLHRDTFEAKCVGARCDKVRYDPYIDDWNIRNIFGGVLSFHKIKTLQKCCVLIAFCAE